MGHLHLRALFLGCTILCPRVPVCIELWCKLGARLQSARFQQHPRRSSASQGVTMAKALFGHVGAAPDRRLLDEVTRLRSRVQALEFEITRLRAENDRLAAAAAEADDLLRLTEPALT